MESTLGYPCNVGPSFSDLHAERTLLRAGAIRTVHALPIDGTVAHACRMGVGRPSATSGCSCALAWPIHIEVHRDCPPDAGHPRSCFLAVLTDLRRVVGRRLSRLAKCTHEGGDTRSSVFSLVYKE